MCRTVASALEVKMYCARASFCGRASEAHTRHIPAYRWEHPALADICTGSTQPQTPGLSAASPEC